tara:strand:+ start:6169 stop:8085 length:1917 start_codon:yes stop_codon:yes gene_type:complete
MATLLTLQNLTLSHPHKQLFKEVTFTLNEGDRIGILGLNGHGKSSLFKVMMGLQEPDITVPPFIYDKSRDLSIFYVPQELLPPGDLNIEDYLYEYYPKFKEIKQKLNVIGEKLALGEEDFEVLLEKQQALFETLTHEGEDRIYNSYVSYLKGFGVEDLSLKVHGLSGGEQRKIALSLGLSCPHQVVLWDEPTNHLDLETIQKFEEELQNVKKTFMVISHDRSLLNNVVERIVHIQNGKLVSFQGTYAEYLIHLQNEDARRVKELDRLENSNRRETAWIRRGAKARRTKSKKRIADYDSLQSSITELKAQASKSVSLNLKSSGRKSKVLIESESIDIGYGTKTLIENFKFALAKGDKIALMGTNGSGKSSLLKVLLGELEPIKGQLRRLDGLDIGHFSQKRESLPNDITPWQLVGEGIDFVMSNTGEKRHVASYLDGFLFKSEEIKRPIHTFSGGEKNRLQLAQFMKHARDLWIFDEPTNDLDLETIGILEEELRSYEGALIIVGHDRTFIENVTEKCWLVHDNHIEIFEAGWPQAEIYLETKELEAQLNKLKPSKTDSKQSAGPSLSNKERARLEKIVVMIEDQETKVEKLESKLAALDYAQADSAEQAQKLNQALEKEKADLDHLIEEWTDLESRKD